MVGALFTGFSGNIYSFDVAVLPKYQGSGIGSKLTNLGIQLYSDQYSESGGELELDAVNDQMVKMLQKRGLKVKIQERGHTIMGRLSRRAKELMVYQGGLPFEEDISLSLGPFTIEEKDSAEAPVTFMNPHHLNENLVQNASRSARLALKLL